VCLVEILNAIQTYTGSNFENWKKCSSSKLQSDNNCSRVNSILKLFCARCKLKISKKPAMFGKVYVFGVLTGFVSLYSKDMQKIQNMSGSEPGVEPAPLTKREV